MSGYVGSKNVSSLSTLKGVDVEVDGIRQRNSIGDNLTIPSTNNQVFFGDTTFSGTVIVNGQMIVAGGSPNFTGTVNIVGTLYTY